MDIETFLEKLSETAEHFGYDWRTNDGFGDALRLHTSNHVYCPITAVCAMETGKSFKSIFFRKAGKVLGLQVKDLFKVANSADSFGREFHFRKKLDEAVLKGLQTDRKG